MSARQLPPPNPSAPSPHLQRLIQRHQLLGQLPLVRHETVNEGQVPADGLLSARLCGRQRACMLCIGNCLLLLRPLLRSRQLL
jgi:hypothetical protein